MGRCRHDHAARHHDSALSGAPAPAAGAEQGRAAHRPDPRLGDRRRRRAGGPIRATADGLRRRHGVRARARRSSRTSSASRCCRCTPTRTPRRRPPAAGPRRCARRPARIIHRAVNGGDDDVVIFCGSGATGAIDKLIRLLELERAERPVVFIGPYEHHSNELPWRESVADVVTIREDDHGRVDLEHLEHELRRHADRRAEDRQLLRRVERDRDRDRRRPGGDRAASPRRARRAGTTPPPGPISRST